MLTKIEDLPRFAVAYASASALILYRGNLYINFKTRVSFSPDPATSRTMRFTTLGSSIVVYDCTLPHELVVPILDNWEIAGMSLRPVEIEESLIGYSN